MKRPEEALQRTVVQFLELALPEDAVFFHVPSGGKRSKAEAGIFKAMGVKAGIPDIIIIHHGRVVAIELKAKGGTLTRVQRSMHTRLILAGAVVKSWATSVEQVEGFLRTIMPLRATTGKQGTRRQQGETP